MYKDRRTQLEARFNGSKSAGLEQIEDCSLQDVGKKKVLLCSRLGDGSPFVRERGTRAWDEMKTVISGR